MLTENLKVFQKFHLYKSGGKNILGLLYPVHCSGQKKKQLSSSSHSGKAIRFVLMLVFKSYEPGSESGVNRTKLSTHKLTE
jgi:hypothetical protein